LTDVESRVAAACSRVGRARESVRLVAVTKTVSEQVIALLPELGIFDLGESRPQVLSRKAEALKQYPIRWHLIGHLQRNKVETTLPQVALLHSVDSMRLLQEVAKWGRQQANPCSILLQVNASREEQKGGWSYEELTTSLDTIQQIDGVQVQGLMGMAAFSDDPEAARPTFRELRQFRDQIQPRWQRGPFDQLSMGMSGDYEVAIEEGATLIRIGSTLFEGLSEN
jgi:pyridoxal phosphate enzyme (YggS family)